MSTWGDIIEEFEPELEAISVCTDLARLARDSWGHELVRHGREQVHVHGAEY